MNPQVRVRAYAKINWTLDVLHKRNDGYHELRTIYQTVSLHDSINLTITNGPIEVVCSDSTVPVDDSNLAYRAAARLKATAAVDSGVKIEITKRIPVAGGLGGGSSDACSTLLGLQQLWSIDYDQRALFGLAAGLGSDVPFFLVGGTCLGVGRGEEVYPIEECEWSDLLLVNPGIQVSTADAYASLSRLTRKNDAHIIPFALLAAKGIRELPLKARNDLEEPVLPAHPEIAEVKRRLIGMGARHALMSGSGATVFGVFDNCEAVAQAQIQMRAIGYWAECVRTVNRQEYQYTIFE